MRPGDSSRETNYGPGGVVARETLTECDLNGDITVTETINGVTTTRNRQRTPGEIAAGDRAQAKQAAAEAAAAARATVQASNQSETLARGAAGETLSGPEQTALIQELSAAVLALTEIID